MSLSIMSVVFQVSYGIVSAIALSFSIILPLIVEKLLIFKLKYLELKSYLDFKYSFCCLEIVKLIVSLSTLSKPLFRKLKLNKSFLPLNLGGLGFLIPLDLFNLKKLFHDF